MGMFGRSRRNLFAEMAQSDPGDMSGEYNTPLSPREEAAFQEWARRTGRQRDVYDYDLRGAWKADARAAGNGHLPDTWKKPNHPTFSVESMYSGAGVRGGNWVPTPDGKWLFFATPDNVRHRDGNALRNYFDQYEPDARLIPPVNALTGRRR